MEKVDFICLCGDMGGSTSGNQIDFNVYKEYIDTYSPNTQVHLATGNHDAEITALTYDATIPYTGNPLYYSFTKDDDVFIIGGGSIYKQLLPYCEKVYVTKINKSHENIDTYFPNLDELDEWTLGESSEVYEYNDFTYQFYV